LTILDNLTESNSVVAGAVTVFYLPDAACIERANRLAGFGIPLVVVDNTPGDDPIHAELMRDLGARIQVILNRENFGIATALNQGVDALLEAGCDWALLFDQDSEPNEAVLRDLPAVANCLATADNAVALVGPAYDDPRLGGVAPFVRFRAFGLERITGERSPVEVDFLISSGSCLNLRCWHAIGPMEDGLFIDYVDLEWCVRARRKGFRVVGIPWITMRHELGGEPLRLPGRVYPSHSAVRHYYLFRNAVLLLRRRDMPWKWKSGEIVKLPVRFVLYGLFFTPRLVHLKMALKGIFDGLRGRIGPLSL
jgi:rhamnosyltransferase